MSYFAVLANGKKAVKRQNSTLFWPHIFDKISRLYGKREESEDMNLSRPNSNDATRTANRSRSVVPMSGLCSRCIDTCTGNCEVFKASFRGRELIYPGPFGDITAGGDKDYPVDY
jgi:hypothetical protein